MRYLKEDEQDLLPTIDILLEEFKYNQLSDEEKETLYTEFKKAYEKATGAAWDEGRFVSRAREWVFYGTIEGGIAVRPQRSGLHKMVAAFGSPKKIIDGFNELDSSLRNDPVWGVMTENLAIMLEKISKGNFKRPPAIFTKTVIPKIAHTFGDDVKGVTSKGAIMVDTPAGVMEKFFICNKNYWRWLLDSAKNTPDKIPVPKPVLTVLIGIAKKLV